MKGLDSQKKMPSGKSTAKRKKVHPVAVNLDQAKQILLHRPGRKKSLSKAHGVNSKAWSHHHV